MWLPFSERNWKMMFTCLHMPIEGMIFYCKDAYRTAHNNHHISINHRHCRSWNIIGAIANIFRCDWCIPLLAGIIPWGAHSLCSSWTNYRSPWVPAPYGLPQGSVLGPLLYIIYTSDIAALLASYSALAQLYADDVQTYLHCSPSDAIATTRVMSSIMRALETWMSSNRLRLNSAKTQFIWLGTRQQLARLDMAALS